MNKKELEELDKLASRFIVGHKGYSQEEIKLVLLRSKLERSYYSRLNEIRTINNLIDSINNKFNKYKKQGGEKLRRNEHEKI
jgi:hypothetical protein